MEHRRIATLATLLAAAALALTACGSSDGPRIYPSSDPGPRILTEKYFAALEAGNATEMCALTLPADQAFCKSKFKKGVPHFKVTHFATHQTYIVGNRALISVTGEICDVANGTCIGASDPNSGMPSPSVTFDQAWAEALGQTPVAASPCAKLNGHWYVVGGA